MSATALWLVLAALAVPVCLGSYRLLFVLDLDVAKFSNALVDALARSDVARFSRLLEMNGSSLPSQLARRAWEVRAQLQEVRIVEQPDVGYREAAPAPDYRVALRKLLAPELNRLHRLLFVTWFPTTFGVLAPALVAFAHGGSASVWQLLAALALLAITLQAARRVRILWQGLDGMIDALLPRLVEAR